MLRVVAALPHLGRGRAATAAILGSACFIVANSLLTAVFGVAAFAQSTIGRSFLGGTAGVQDLNDDVYGGPLFTTAGIGLLLFLAGAILLGAAISRAGAELRWVGVGFAATLVLFVLGFVFLDVAQPIGAALLAVVGVILALRLPRSVGDRPERSAYPAARSLGGLASGSKTPVSYASTTAWTRSRRSSFWRMCVMWVLTVASLM